MEVKIVNGKNFKVGVLTNQDFIEVMSNFNLSVEEIPIPIIQGFDPFLQFSKYKFGKTSYFSPKSNIDVNVYILDTEFIDSWDEVVKQNIVFQTSELLSEEEEKALEYEMYLYGYKPEKFEE